RQACSSSRRRSYCTTPRSHRPPSDREARTGCPAKPRSAEHTSELQSHRDLHSFPTRRSSDLGKLALPAAGDHIAQLPDRIVHHRIVRLGRGAQQSLDRQSTRLNSSHTEIYTLSLHDALPI